MATWIAAGTLAGWVSGCSSLFGCEDQGCSSGVLVDIPEVEVDPGELITIHACVNGTCGVQRQDWAGGQVAVHVPEDADDVAVAVTVKDSSGRDLARGAGIARVQLERPNGVACPPTCRVVRVRLTGARLEDAA